MPFLRLFAMAWPLGIGLACWLDDGGGLGLPVRIVATAVGVLGLVLVGRRAPRLGLFLYASAVAASVATPWRRAPAQLYDARPWSLSARVDGMPRRDNASAVFPVALSAAGRLLPDRDAAGRLRARLLDGPSAEFGPGDNLLMRATVVAPGRRCNFGACDGDWRAAADAVDGTVFLAGSAQVARLDLPPAGIAARLWLLRRQMHAAIDAHLPEADAALVAALVTGDRGSVSADEERRFRAAGVTHLLSVSGLHLAFAAGLLFALVDWMLRWLAPGLGRRRPRDRWAAVVALPIVIAYTLLTGAEVATVRAAAVVAYAFVGLLVARRVRAIDALAFASLSILVARPASLLDPSFQLSFVAAMATLFGVSAPCGPPPAARWRRALRWARRLCAASLAATVATAPITALHFSEIAPMGVVSNLVAVPLTELGIVPVGLVGAFLSASGSRLGGLVLLVAGFLSAMLRAFVAAVAAISPVAQVPAPSVLVLVCCAVGLVWIARATSARLRRTVVVFGVVATCVAGEVLFARLFPCVEITFLDVGQGDAALVRLPDGRAIVIDGGGASAGGHSDPGAQIVVPMLRRLGVRRLALVVLSHPHADHAGGLPEVLLQLPVDELWTNGQASADPSVRAVLSAASRRQVSLGQPRPLAIGGLVVDVLGPRGPSGAVEHDPLASENDNSLVLRLRYAGRSVLFSGDIESDGERALVEAGTEPVDVLKVPHHGSRTSSGEPLLAALAPQVAIASLADGNRHRFPHPEVLGRYRSHAIRFLRTDRVGAVRLRIGPTGALSFTCARPWGC